MAWVQPLAVVSLVLSFVSCGTKTDAVIANCDTAADITYDEHIAPLVRSHCLRCHSSTKPGLAPAGTEYDTYQQVVDASTSMKLYINSGKMPSDVPGGLPEKERCLFTTWIDQGFQR